MTMQTVPFEGDASNRATLLLAAAEELDLPVEVVETVTGAFRAPEEVVKKAGLSGSVATESEDGDPVHASSLESAEGPSSLEREDTKAEASARKATAKKAAAKTEE